MICLCIASKIIEGQICWNSRFRMNSVCLFSGLEKILSAVAEIRNKGSDSHGIGARRINIEEHHARLFVNSAMTMADFVLAVGDRNAG